MKHTLLEPKAFKENLESSSDGILVDVRTPAEYRAAHIQGAKNLPLDSKELSALSHEKSEKQIFIHCQAGKRSSMAVDKLKDSPHTIIELKGGLNAWINAGLNYEEGKGAISIERQVRIAAGTLVFIGSVLSIFGMSAGSYLSGFVGAGLVFAGITDTCGMALVLARMPWNK